MIDKTTIKRLAAQCGIGAMHIEAEATTAIPYQQFLAFAEAVAAHEREACAQTCINTKTGADWKLDPDGSYADERSDHCAEEIRKRGQS